MNITNVFAPNTLPDKNTLTPFHPLTHPVSPTMSLSISSPVSLFQGRFPIVYVYRGVFTKPLQRGFIDGEKVRLCGSIPSSGHLTSHEKSTYTSPCLVYMSVDMCCYEWRAEGLCCVHSY